MKTAMPTAARIIAVNFAENSYLEMLLRLRARDRKTYDTLSPALRMSVNIYSANKREFEHLQSIKTEAPARSRAGNQNRGRVRRESYARKGK